MWGGNGAILLVKVNVLVMSTTQPVKTLQLHMLMLHVSVIVKVKNEKERSGLRCYFQK